MNFILIKRSQGEFKDFWALPGGFVEYGESVECAAIREAKEETSIDVELIDLVNVYSKPDRDPRGHTVTVAYTANGQVTLSPNKMNKLAAAIILTSQGIPFIHSGDEILRTKKDRDGKLIENSYKSSDFVNKFDWIRKEKYIDVFN